MSFWLYQALYCVGFLLSLIVSPFVPKIKAGIKGRRKLLEQIPKSLRSPIWFHVASSGELEQCFAVMDLIKRTRPTQSVFITYFSGTAITNLVKESHMRKEAGIELSWDGSSYAPYDFFFLALDFVKHLNPTALVCVNKEVWPGLITACKKNNVKVFLIAANFREKNKLKIQCQLPWLRQLFLIDAVNESTTLHIRKLLKGSSTQVKVSGDPRIERVLLRKKRLGSPQWANYFKSPVLLLSSVWDEDFKALSSVIGHVLTHNPDWRVIIVPHEPTMPRVSSYLDFCEKKSTGVASCSVDRWSQWLSNPKSFGHLIVDDVGFLAELYSISTIVFVGGSFKGRVHNVLEPAAYAKPIVTGPYIENSTEAVEMFSEGGLIMSSNKTQLKDSIVSLLNSLELRKKVGEKAYAYLSAKSGASQKISNMLLCESY